MNEIDISVLKKMDGYDLSVNGGVVYSAKTYEEIFAEMQRIIQEKDK